MFHEGRHCLGLFRVCLGFFGGGLRDSTPPSKGESGHESGFWDPQSLRVALWQYLSWSSLLVWGAWTTFSTCGVSHPLGAHRTLIQLTSSLTRTPYWSGVVICGPVPALIVAPQEVCVGDRALNLKCCSRWSCEHRGLGRIDSVNSFLQKISFFIPPLLPARQHIRR